MLFAHRVHFAVMPYITAFTLKIQGVITTESHHLQILPPCRALQYWSPLFRRSLSEKGYNPVNQIVGYIMSGDPTYITSHKNARSLIMKVERDELVEELLTEYIRTKHWK
jgi:uncharacterized protein (UPF0297 family)